MHDGETRRCAGEGGYRSSCPLSTPHTHTHTCMVNQREKETLLMACAGPRCRRAEMEEMIAEMLFYRGDAGISLVGMEGW